MAEGKAPLKLYKAGSGPSYDNMMGTENVLKRREDVKVPEEDLPIDITPPNDKGPKGYLREDTYGDFERYRD